MTWVLIQFSYWAIINTWVGFDIFKLNILMYGQLNYDMGLSQRLKRKLQGTNNPPQSLCSREEEELQACKLQRVKRGRATEHRHILHNVELDPWGCHTHHVTAVNYICVCMWAGLRVYAVRVWVCVFVSEINIIYSFQPVWALKICISKYIGKDQNIRQSSMTFFAQDDL